MVVCRTEGTQRMLLLHIIFASLQIHALVQDKSGTRVGHLNIILALGREFGRSNLQNFKCRGGCSGGGGGGGGALKFRIDRRIMLNIQPRPQGFLGVQSGGLEKTLSNSRSRDLKLTNPNARCQFETTKSPIFLETRDPLFAGVFSEQPF